MRSQNYNIKQQFKKSIELGIGRAYLLLKKYPKIDFSHYIIVASINNLAYDGQSEGDRSWYLWQLIQSSPQKEKIIDTLLLVLQKEKEYMIDLEQLFNLARYFASKKRYQARKIIYQRYKKEFHGCCTWCGESAIIAMDGIRGVCFIAKMYGKAYMNDSEYYLYGSSYRIKTFEDENPNVNLMQIFKQQAKESKYINAYLELLEKEKKHKEERTKTTFNYQSVKERIENKQRVLSYMVKNFTQQEFEQLAEDFLNEKDSQIKSYYLKIFSYIQFPKDYNILLDIAKNSKDQCNQLTEYAVNALKFFTSSKIRQLALKKLSQNKCPENYIQLLIYNYQNGDEMILKKIIENYNDTEKIHSLIYPYLEIYENNPTLKCRKIFEIFYEKMNCGIHRYDIVVLLHENGLLSDKIKKEMSYDSYEDIRTFSKEIGNQNEKL